MAKVISVANQKGGVGKTTTCVELAKIFSNNGNRVLMIDMDQQGNLTSQFCQRIDTPVAVTYTIYDIMTGKNKENGDPVTITDAIIEVGENLDLLASSPELSRADRSFMDYDDFLLLKDITELLSDQYDYIMIDNSPARNILLTMAYAASDYIIIPAECDTFSFSGIQAIKEDLSKMTARGNTHCKIIAVILTKNEHTNAHAAALETLTAMRDQDAMPYGIYTVSKGIVAVESKSFKQTIQEYSKYSKIAMEYRKIAADIEKNIKMVD